MTSAHPLQRIDRIRTRLTAGQRLAPEDAADLAAAIDRAVEEGCSIDHGLDLAPGWQVALQRRELFAALAMLQASAGDGSRIFDRELARRIVSDLTRYVASGYSRDREQSKIPAGKKGLFYRLIACNGGRIPSAESVRKWVNESRFVYPKNRRSSSRQQLETE